ncbi:hypothetical protein ACLKMH_14645 [Psychromonas sp. KJ10-10]|uniref:hypothetical protein n=1 Tax=Psychromonas sp. KJ10-10 TaxID=3391823 RepID=UPI0039B64C79
MVSKIMFKTKTVIKQTARRTPAVNFLISLLISGFSIIFIPLAYENLYTSFFSLLIISYFVVHLTLGLSSRITINQALEYSVKIPDHSSNMTQTIPFESITYIEVCAYKVLKVDNNCPDEISQKYFYQKSLFGYQGAGLIIAYKLPGNRAESEIIRAIKIPAPKAEEFYQFITVNTNCCSIK